MIAPRWTRIAIVIALLLAVGAVVTLKRSQASPDVKQPPARETPAPGQARLPRLLDLGAEKCMACKMMVPVLADLRKSHEGRLTVDFVDVWKTPEAARAHGVETIPTQIFFDATGRELYRHTGFISKDDILVRFRELGVKL